MSRRALRRRLRRALRRLWRAALWSSAVVLVLVALAVSGLRLLLPWLPEQQARLERFAAASLGRPVSIGRLDTAWRWFRPYLIAHGVHVDGGGAMPFDAERVEVGFSLWRSLAALSPVVVDVGVVGTELTLTRDREGRLYFQGRPLDPVPEGIGAAGAWPVPDWLRGRRVRLEQVELALADEASRWRGRVATRGAALALRGDGVDLALDLVPPADFGAALRLILELRGPVLSAGALAGRAYLDARGLELGVLAALAPPSWPRLAGRADVELWLDLAGAGRGRVQARFAVEDLLLPGDGRSPAAAWSRLAGRLRVQRDRAGRLRVDLAELRFRGAGGVSAAGALSLDATADGRRGTLAAAHLRLADLLPWLRRLPGAPALPDWGWQGDIEALALRWERDAAEPLRRAQAVFRGLGYRRDPRGGSVQGIGGRADWRDGRLWLDLGCDALRVHLPGLFRQPLPELVLDGSLLLRRTGGGWRLSARDLWLDTPHGQTRHWFDVDWRPGAAPWVNAWGRVEAFDVSAAPLYYPAGIMGEALLAWLDAAPLSGVARDGEYRLRGRLDRFPFRDGDGRFRVRFETAGNGVAFWSPGPTAAAVDATVLFHEAGLSIDGHRLRVLDTEVGNLVLDIADYRETPLEVQADLDGPLADAVAYLQRSLLAELFGPALGPLAASGRQAGRLNLRIPLRHGQDWDWRLSTQLDDGRLVYAGGWRLEGLAGPFELSRRRYHAAPRPARFNGQPVELRLDTAAGRARLQLAGTLDAAALLAEAGLPAGDRLAGRSPWTLILGWSAEHGLPLTLRAESPLAGTALRLPAPLDKPAALRRPVSAELRLDGPGLRLAFRHGERWHGVLKWRFEPALRFWGGELRGDGRPAPDPAAPGLRLQAAVERVDLEGWWAFLAPWLGRAAGEPPLSAARLRAARVEGWGGVLQAATLDLERELHHWRLDVASPAVGGTLRVPRQGFATRGLVIRAGHLDLDAIGLGAAPSSGPLDPHRLPPVQAEIARLRVHGMDLRGVSLLGDAGPEGWRLHRLRLDDAVLGADIEGAMRAAAAGPESHVTFTARSADAGKALARLGYRELLEGGRGRLQGELRWPGPLWRPDPARLSGTLDLALDDGRIVEVEPGGGRLLGLLSLQMIPRRLVLDFGDLFGRGFPFDKMRGRFTLRDGQAFTEDYLIDGPIGRITVRGRIGLAARDYDQVLEFRPDLSNSLPLVGALIGGSGAGWALVLVDRVARVFGKQLDDLVRVRYRITGPWEQPRVERIETRRLGTSAPAAPKSPAP